MKKIILFGLVFLISILIVSAVITRKFFDEFNDLTQWTAQGAGLWEIVSGAAEGNDCGVWTNLTTGNIDLSNCAAGSGKAEWGSLDTQALEATDCLNYTYSSNGGTTWATQAKDFCGNRNSLVNVLFNIPDAALTTQFKWRFTCIGVSSSEEVVINNFNITCDVGDTTAPVINGTLNNTAPQQGMVVNATYNATDVGGGLDTCIFLMNGTADGSFIVLNYTFPTKPETGQCSQNWTIDLAAGSVINFSVLVNDTSTATAGGNKKQNDTIIMVAATPDTTPPVVNTSLNKSLTNILQNDVINLTANVTDNIGLSFCQIIINQSGPTALEIINISLSGTTGQCYNVSTVTLAAGGVINYTIRVNDTSNRFRTNDTIITVASADDCSCPASGHWIIDDGSNCGLTTTCDLGTNKLYVNNGRLRIGSGGKLYAQSLIINFINGGLAVDFINGALALRNN